jgi:hypothetical protein
MSRPGRVSEWNFEDFLRKACAAQTMVVVFDEDRLVGS